jgi:hypothetical protein
MRLNTEDTYIFYDIDKHGTIFNHSQMMFRRDFVLMTRIAPDLDSVDEVLARPEVGYHKQCVIGKNGKHTGLFFTSLINHAGETVHLVEYCWWQNPKGGDPRDESLDEEQSLKIYVTAEECRELDIVATRFDDTIVLTVNGREIEGQVNNMIDYSTSHMWVGAANMLKFAKPDFDPHFACMYTGDISLMHIQEAPLPQKHIKTFFDNFWEFLDLKLDVKENCIYCTTNFQERTPYKVRDYSGNGFHPLLFSHDWIG